MKKHQLPELLIGFRQWSIKGAVARTEHLSNQLLYNNERTQRSFAPLPQILMQHYNDNLYYNNNLYYRGDVYRRLYFDTCREKKGGLKAREQN